jgi:hypothetical protein
MLEQQWARLREDVDCGLRRGAWYRTVVRSWTEVLLEVHGRRKSVPVQYLELEAKRPNSWTVVTNASNAAVIPERWARGYAVCPRCSYRQLPVGQPSSLRCDDCGGVFDVAWDKPYLTPMSGN